MVRGLLSEAVKVITEEKPFIHASFIAAVPVRNASIMGKKRSRPATLSTMLYNKHVLNAGNIKLLQE